MKPLVGIAICILAGAAWAQTDSQLTPRQIFDFGVKAPDTPPKKPSGPKPVEHNPPPGKPPDDSASKPAPVPLALRYSILQKKGDDFVEVNPESEFHSGDLIRVRVESNRSAYLYIVLIGSSGQARVLFPDKEIDNGNNRVPAGQPFTVPSEKDPPFLFDKTAGIEKVSLILTRSPEPDLEKLIYAAGDPRRTVIDGAVLGGVRDKLVSRDLVVEKYDGKDEKAVYATTKDKSADAPLFVDLQLTHK